MSRCPSGDVDGDETVTAVDAAAALRLVDRHQFNKAADIDGDGYVTNYDAALILRLAVGLAA